MLNKGNYITQRTQTTSELRQFCSNIFLKFTLTIIPWAAVSVTTSCNDRRIPRNKINIPIQVFTALLHKPVCAVLFYIAVFKTFPTVKWALSHSNKTRNVQHGHSVYLTKSYQKVLYNVIIGSFFRYLRLRVAPRVNRLEIRNKTNEMYSFLIRKSMKVEVNVREILPSIDMLNVRNNCCMFCNFIIKPTSRHVAPRNSFVSI